MSVILVVDDDAPTREALATGLKKLGHEILSAATGAAAIDEVRRHEIDLAIIDLRLPDMVGTELFGALRILRPEAIAIMISGHATVDEAVSALKRGIYDFITKDFRMGELRKVVSKALETQKLLVENERLRQALKERSASGRMMGRAAAFLKIMQTVGQIAPMKSTVLLSGESGVGKELIADAIHHQSPRRHRPLVKLNCGALPEGLIESELFGHEKGAFTGAIQQRKGRFELADGGSIFLDEISEMPPATQVKLLRVLQEGEFERVGGTQTLKGDVRIIAATNVDLEAAVAEGRFRKDLFYRLNVIHLIIPPLRDRGEDIPLLALYFLDKFCLENDRSAMGFTPNAMAGLKKLSLARQYPGTAERGGTGRGPDHRQYGAPGGPAGRDSPAPPRRRQDRAAGGGDHGGDRTPGHPPDPEKDPWRQGTGGPPPGHRPGHPVPPPEGDGSERAHVRGAGKWLV